MKEFKGDKSKRSVEIFSNIEILKTSFRSYLNKKRIFFTELFLFLPIVIPLFFIYRELSGGVNIWSSAERDAVSFFINNIYGVYLSILLPLTIAIFASYTISDEFKNKTIFYLLNRPVSRAWIVIYKYLSLIPASIVITLPPIIANMIFYGLADPQTNWGKVLEWLWNLSVAAFWYALIIMAIVVVFSFITKKAIILSIVYALGYETFGYQVLSPFFDNLRFAFGSYYIQCYLVHTISEYTLSPLSNLSKFLPAWNAIIIIILIIGFCLTLAYIILENKEYR